MKKYGNIDLFKTVDVRPFAMLVVLATMAWPWSAEAQHRKSGNSARTTISHSSQINNTQSHGSRISSPLQQTPVVRRSAPSPAGPAIRPEVARPKANDFSPAAKWRQTPSVSRGWSGSQQTRSWPVGGNDKRFDSKIGTLPLNVSEWGRRGGAAVNSSRATSPKSISQAQFLENRTKLDDVRRRLDDSRHGNSTQTLNLRRRDIALPGGFKLGTITSKYAEPSLLISPRGHPAISSATIRSANGVRFPDQWKTGKLDRLNNGETAKQIKLADQYRMSKQGDVARRLHLHKSPTAKEKHGGPAAASHRDLDAGHGYRPHPNFSHHGKVHPAYGQHCVKHRYWGPAFFAGVCWYPRWRPWVNWSWHYRCHPFWDPRPIWCRPAIYAPCPVWVYWDTPLWTPLPLIACGTWVDLEPPIVAAAQWDLQLLAVRFVDPGHPEQKLGPRYRVWFRNNGNRRITQPFNIVLFAANDDRLAAGLPQAGVHVTAIDPGDVQNVDIRLPVEVYAMDRDAQGNPAPFRTLHVLVDANRETPDILRNNNGARLDRAEILPVDPAAFELDCRAARPGDQVILAGEGLGPEPGQVLICVDGKELQGEILGWYDLGVRWTLPLDIKAPTEAEVIVIRGDGAAANPLRITVNR